MVPQHLTQNVFICFDSSSGNCCCDNLTLYARYCHMRSVGQMATELRTGYYGGLRIGPAH